ncbi:MAG TPA: 4-alpha-glucanotransferase, partial [Nitrospira sp.]
MSRKAQPVKTNRSRKAQKATKAGSNRQLRQLAASCGVSPSYIDEGGSRRLVAGASLRRVLAVMGVKADTPEQVRQSLRDIRTNRWRILLDPVMVVRETKLPRTFSVRLQAEADDIRRLRFAWKLAKEQGGATTGRQTGATAKIAKKSMVDGLCHYELALPFPQSLPLGYHALSLEASGPRGSKRATMTVIVVPASSYLHARVKGSRRAWGITVQLYGLRSRNNWGIGDFRDLTGMIIWAGAELGADLLGVNPLHAL